MQLEEQIYLVRLAAPGIFLRKVFVLVNNLFVETLGGLVSAAVLFNECKTRIRNPNATSQG